MVLLFVFKKCDRSLVFCGDKVRSRSCSLWWRNAIAVLFFVKGDRGFICFEKAITMFVKGDLENSMIATS